MKSINKFLYTLLIASFLLISCEGEFDSLVDANAERNPIPDMTVEASQGDADFSNYIAIGNSITAGYMDGALYNNGQRFSLPALLSAQFEYTGAPSTFNQPDINSVNGFNTNVNTGEPPILGRFKLDPNIPGPSPTVNGDPISGYDGDTSSLNNFGIPGVKVGHLLTPQLAENPFYARIASGSGSTLLGDAISTNPTFFTLWVGNQDLLHYALSGATNLEELTTQEAFQQQFEAVIGNLMTHTQASGVVGNIPQVLAVPFFRAVAYNVIGFDENSPEDQATVNALNEGFSGLNQVLDGIVQFPGHSQADANRRKVQYSTGANPILIRDPNLENIEPKLRQLAAVNPALTNADVDALQPYYQSRPIEQGELVLLTAATVLGTLADPENPNTPIGVVIPLGPEYTLTHENLVEIETARQTFNAMIGGVVSAANTQGKRLALYDTNALDGAFAEIFGLDGSAPGIDIDGVRLQPDFSPNGVFSTDGVHPNPRGSAILANEFIRVIESEFNAIIPKVDVLALPGVSLCAGDCVSQQGGS